MVLMSVRFLIGLPVFQASKGGSSYAAFSRGGAATARVTWLFACRHAWLFRLDLLLEPAGGADEGFGRACRHLGCAFSDPGSSNKA